MEDGQLGIVTQTDMSGGTPVGGKAGAFRYSLQIALSLSLALSLLLISVSASRSPLSVT